MGGAVVLALAQRLSRGAVPAEVASQVKGAILSGPAIRVSAKLQVGWRAFWGRPQPNPGGCSACRPSSSRLKLHFVWPEGSGAHL
jgi:alpha-beta hydrolase superfamily lysophospholipase